MGLMRGAEGFMGEGRAGTLVMGPVKRGGGGAEMGAWAGRDSGRSEVQGYRSMPK